MITKAEALSGLKKYHNSIKDSLSSAYELPTASASVKGGVKIGDGLEMTGDTLYVTISGGESYDSFTGATSISSGAAGLVPAPLVGAENYFLRGDGNWATIEGGENSMAYILSDHIATIEGGFWAQEVNDTPYLRLRHGSYIYNFAYDAATIVEGEGATAATATPDTYILGTTPVTTEGGVWYDASGVAPVLKMRKGNFIFDFHRDNLTWAGGNSSLTGYLPFDGSTTADTFGNTWTAYGNASLDNTEKMFGNSSIHLPNGAYLHSESFIDINADKWTFDTWVKWTWKSQFGPLLALGSATESATSSGIVLLAVGGRVSNASGSSWQEDWSYTPVTQNQWAHLAIVKNGSDLLFFTNGVCMCTKTVNGTISDSGAISLGAWGTDGGIDAYFDNVRFFNGVALWSETFTPPTAEDYI